MCRKLIYVVCFVLVLAGSTKLQAQQEVPFFSDDFNTVHDYHNPPNNIGGTGWDGYTGWQTDETVDELTASINRAGQLYIESTGSMWGGSGSVFVPLGPFLYKVVEGDFKATVELTDYAGTEEEPVFHNDAGLMARVPNPEDSNYAGLGEDWVCIDYFPIWDCGNFVWDCNDNTVFEAGSNGLEWDAHRYLQLERSGNTIILRTKADVNDEWVEMGPSPRPRPDFEGLPLQVGLRHATYDAAVTGYAAFDNFSIVLIVRFKAYNAVPGDEAVNVDPDADLSWSPGSEAKFHDVYFGTDFNDVNEATDPNVLPGRGRQSETTYEPGTMEFGRTYYWRIDEVNDPNFWRGDVWSFTVIRLEASEPSPSDGAECVSRDIGLLSWTPGGKAKATYGHWVYFGTTSPPPFKGVRSEPNYPVPLLEYDTLYYWRIDEKNTDGSTTTGDEWSFRTVHQIAPAEPNLIGWWKLDGTSCETIALDSSGYDRHGTLVNGPVYVEGYDGLSLGLDGRDDYVDLPIGEDINSLTNSTFMIWVNSKFGGQWVRTFDFGTDDPNFYMCLGLRWYFMDEMYFAITTTDTLAVPNLVITTGFDFPPDEWHNVAVTVDADANTFTLYYDGVLAAQALNTTLTPSDLGETTNNWLGRSHSAADSYYEGSMYDFRIYNRVLTEQEIRDRITPKRAWVPNPEDGATDVPKTVTLSWRPGKYAADVNGHDVYFGTDEDAVTDANNSDPCGPGEIYKGRQDANTYGPITLEFGTTYYWRIDEVNEAGPPPGIWRGHIWSFTTAGYNGVEDFDSYAADVNLHAVWKDYFTQVPYTSAQVYVETGAADANFVRDGNSMRYWYRNDLEPYFSESYADTADLPSSIGSDWTADGVKALVLYFYGQSDNDANEQMYVKLHDADSNATVTYGDYGEDPNDLRVEEWQQWNIDLEDFNSANVDLTNVTRITIGFGDGSAGGEGTVYFEDIQLHPPRCVPSRGRPAGDFDNDCDVDYDDLDIIVSNWLISDYNVIPVEVDPYSDPNLLAHYEFEGDFNDSSGNGNHGDPCGSVSIIASGDPCRGQVASFDGNDGYVELPIGADINSMTNSTFMTWVDFNSASTGAWQRIFDFGNNETVYMFLSPRIDVDGVMRFAITTSGGGNEEIVNAADTLAGGWHQVAVTIDADNDTIGLYLDGVLVGRNIAATLTPSDLGVTTQNWLGRSQYDVDAYFDGSLDDFCIYDRALSDGEIAWIYGLRDEFTQPLYLLLTPANPNINAYDDDTIDFKDYAAMADTWLEEQLWP